jgi:hypothetical protein
MFKHYFKKWLLIFAPSFHPNKLTMAQSILHKAATRGHADHGWLNAWHSFSFADHHDPERMHFGVLRVLNDDTIAAGMGFGMHPHNNMEIITIPLEGSLAHKDSMGNSAIISAGDVQVMSAGTGIRHSEFNPNDGQQTKLLQIWLFPKKQNVAPRYDQLTLNPAHRHNQLQQVISPNADDAGVWIHQDAWFHLGRFDKEFTTTYTIRKAGNGVYAFVIKGDITINGQLLNERDALGVWDTDAITIEAASDDAELLLMDLPMTI